MPFDIEQDCVRVINVSLRADMDFSSVTTFKSGIEWMCVLILPSFLDGVCDLCVCFIFLGSCKSF